jgi:rhamnosyltransferase subunit B
MKVLLLPFGSYGDVHPFFGLGLELKRHGHDIVMITNAHFRKLAGASGGPRNGRPMQDALPGKIS